MEEVLQILTHGIQLTTLIIYIHDAKEEKYRIH